MLIFCEVIRSSVTFDDRTFFREKTGNVLSTELRDKNENIIMQRDLNSPLLVSNLRVPNLHTVPEYRDLQTVQQFLRMKKLRYGV